MDWAKDTAATASRTATTGTPNALAAIVAAVLTGLRIAFWAIERAREVARTLSTSETPARARAWAPCLGWSPRRTAFAIHSSGDWPGRGESRPRRLNWRSRARSKAGARF